MRLDLRYLKIDANGWAQADRRPAWRPSKKKLTRRGLPWTPAEDQALLQRVAGAASIGYADPTIEAASVAHGRSTCSITTRICALRAGIRLAEHVRDPQPSSAAPNASPTSDSDVK